MTFKHFVMFLFLYEVVTLIFDSKFLGRKVIKSRQSPVENFTFFPV